MITKAIQIYRIVRFELIHLRILIVGWLVAWAGMVVLLFLLFDDIAANQENLQNFLLTFPPELLQAFGSNIDNFGNITGYYNSQFTSLYLISIAILGVFLGMRSIAGEINSRSLIMLFSRPVGRAQIFCAKLLALSLFMAITSFIVVIMSGLSVIILTEVEVIPWRFFGLTGIALFVFGNLFTTLGLTAGIITPKLGTALGIIYTIAAFFVNSLSSFTNFPQVLSYFSVYRYIDLNLLASETQLEINGILILLLITLVAFVAGGIRFRSLAVND